MSLAISSGLDETTLVSTLSEGRYLILNVNLCYMFVYIEDWKHNIPLHSCTFLCPCIWAYTVFNEMPVSQNVYYLFGTDHIYAWARKNKDDVAASSVTLLNNAECLFYSHFKNIFSLLHLPSVPLFLQTCYRALRQTLEIVSAFHDIVSYIFTFAQLGSASGCLHYVCSEHLAADWGGTERIG